jgi:2-oxoglutarate ferredoxin oxidoreductase subunit alpha
MGHGDSEHIILLPGSINECFEFGWRAFDIAERFQTPVFVLSDLDFGMNQWMTLPFEYPNEPMDRGKVLWEEDIAQRNGDWGRYRDVDGDGIPYRTLPGNRHPNAAYFARGTGHDENARYTEDSQTWHDLLDRLKRKFINARQHLPAPVIEMTPDVQTGIISFGSTEPAILEARFLLNKTGLLTNFMRIRAVPFMDQVGKFIEQNERCYVVEMNRDGQLKQLLTLAYPELATKLISVAYTDGLPLTAKLVRDHVLAKEGR